MWYHVSFHPSVIIVNGLVLIFVNAFLLKMTSHYFIYYAHVFVQEHLKFCAVGESLKHSLNKELKWAPTANGTLFSTAANFTLDLVCNKEY